MSWVSAIVVVEDYELLILAALDDLIRASAELVLDLVDHGHDEGRDEGEDKHRKLVLELLNDLGQNGNLLNLLRDGLKNLIMELNNRHDLLEDVPDVQGILLRIARRDRRLLHLGGIGVVLKLLHLRFLVTTEHTVGDLVQQVLQDASITVLALLQGALELFDLVLRQLIGHLARYRVQEVNTAKSASHTGIDFVASPAETHASAATDMWENIALAHLNQSKLAVVAVRQEIYDIMLE